MEEAEQSDILYRFHSHLESFLNGYTLSHISKIFYPVIDYNTVFWCSEISKQECQKEFPKTSELLISGKNLSSREVAAMISSFYRELDEKIPKPKKDYVEIWRDYKEWLKEANAIWEPKLEIIPKIKDYVDHDLKDYVVDFFIHGSFSTLDYTKWSDLDLLIILKKETVEDTKKLIAVRKKIIKLNKSLFLNDPLQHHGIFIIAEPEMGTYIQSFFPTELFKYSTAFYGTKKLMFNVIPSRMYVRNVLKSLLNYIKHFPDNFSLYDWKLFCHAILLIPSLYIEAKGRYIYKKFSFDAAKGDFSKGDWEVIEQISRLRRVFYYNPFWTKLFLIMPTYWYLVAFIRFFIKGPKNVDDLIKKGKRFAEAVEEKVGTYDEKVL
jgi:predicted nucleotidyltransferase